MKRLKLFLPLILTCAALVGCASKLESGGAYAPAKIVIENGTTNTVATAAPDKAFFVVDAAFDLAWASANAAFEFEKKNRILLFKISPNIKHTLDKIRPPAFEAVQRYALARDAYEANPTPAGLSKLQTILGQVEQFSNAAQAALPQ